MKRLCAILLGLMMLAGLCACGRRTSPAPAPKTPEPVTVITPAQPTPSEAEVGPVSAPDGTTPRTAAVTKARRLVMGHIPADSPLRRSGRGG